MSEQTKYLRNGPSLVDMLTVAFVVLKLCEVIDWSWWLVISPQYFSLALSFVVAAANLKKSEKWKAR